MAEDGFRVTLNVYDLSQGLARQLSTSFLGKAIEAIWHTGVVIYGYEYYFGGGIQHDPAGTTPYGTPIRVVDLGLTHVPKEVFDEYLQEISSRYTAESYNLLSHNCNNFSNEVAQFLVGSGIPDYILQLPNEVMNSPMGALICKTILCFSQFKFVEPTSHQSLIVCHIYAVPMIQQLETTLRSGAVPQAPQFRPTASTTRSSIPKAADSSSKKSGDFMKTDNKTDNAVPPLPAVKSVTVEEEKFAVADPLGDARSRVQEEITREFAAIMASGTLRASEAAALATRRVMERHGRTNVPMQRG